MLERFKKGENSIISTRRGSEDLNNIATISYLPNKRPPIH